MVRSSNRKVAVSKTGCAVETALGLIGGRWKGVVIYWLLKEKRRFGELWREFDQGAHPLVVEALDLNKE